MKVVDTSSSTEKSSLVAQILAFAASNFLLVAFLAVVGRCAYKKYASPLKNVPGPWLASVSRLWKGELGTSDMLILLANAWNDSMEHI